MAHQACPLRTAPASVGRQQHLGARTGGYRGGCRVAAYFERIRYHSVTVATTTTSGRRRRGHTRMRRVSVTVRRRQIVQRRNGVRRRVGQQTVVVSIAQQVIGCRRRCSGTARR